MFGHIAQPQSDVDRTLTMQSALRSPTRLLNRKLIKKPLNQVLTFHIFCIHSFSVIQPLVETICAVIYMKLFFPCQSAIVVSMISNEPVLNYTMVSQFTCQSDCKERKTSYFASKCNLLYYQHPENCLQCDINFRTICLSSHYCSASGIVF